MPATNNIILKPRFKLELNQSNQTVLKHFETLKTTQSSFIVSRLDNHVYIKFPKKNTIFGRHNCIQKLTKPIKTLENYTVSMALTLPFGLCLCFFILLQRHYLQVQAFGHTLIQRLKSSYAVPVALMLFMVIIWFALYFLAQIGKASSKNNMHKLQDFMNSVINKKAS